MTDRARLALVFIALLAMSFGFGVSASLGGALVGFIIVLALPALFIALLAGTTVFLWRGIKLARKPGRHVRSRILDIATAPVLAFILLALSTPTVSMGSLTGAWLRLLSNRTQYEAIIASLEAGHRDPADGQHRSERGITFIADRGPPLRVAFNPEGILDNWSGIVFDPSQDVVNAAPFDPASGNGGARQSITSLFGGDLVRCRRLGGSYFFCSFT